MAPAAFEYVPSSHDRHAVAPFVSMYCPIGQKVHDPVAIVAAVKRPATHSTHVSVIASFTKPALQPQRPLAASQMSPVLVVQSMCAPQPQVPSLGVSPLVWVHADDRVQALFAHVRPEAGVHSTAEQVQTSVLGETPVVSVHEGDKLHCPATGEQTRPWPARHAPDLPQLQEPRLGVVLLVKGHLGARKMQMQG